MTQTQTQSENERIRGYLIAQANKLSIPELVEKVRTDGAQLEHAADAIPAPRFAEPPAPGEWSAAEVWTHILQMTEHGAGSIEGILDERRQPHATLDTISGETRSDLQTDGDYWQAYIGRRERLYDRVLKARGDEHLDLRMTHPMFGDFSWREWLLFMRVHDLDHLRQLQSIGEALGAQPAG